MKNNFKKVGFLAVLLLCVQLLFAQITITGKVTDSKQEELPGVTIVVKGTTDGTVTNVDGSYSLSVPENAEVLVFSFIGMKTKEVAIDGQKQIDVTLNDKSFDVDEVVVVGYGTQTKANLTGAVASVDLSTLENRPAANTATLLQGQMTGVTVSNFNNQPGKDNPQIIIRGEGTLNAGTAPLIIVDGVESSLANIPANDIESISVLKDAASAAIYGVRAANGVIVVKTKRGKGAEPTVQFNTSFAMQQAIIEPDLVDSWDFAKIMNLDYTEKGQDAWFTDEAIQLMKDGTQPDRYANTDWFEELYDNAQMFTTYLSVSGAKKDVRYMFSVNYLDQDGIMIQTGQKKYNFRSNIDVDITKRFNIGLNLSGNRRDITEPVSSAGPTNGSTGGLNYQLRRSAVPTVPLKYSNGEWGQVDGNYYIPGSQATLTKNPVENVYRGHNNTTSIGFTFKLFADLEIIKNLHWRPSFAYLHGSALNSRFNPTFTTYDADGEMVSENTHNSLSNSNNESMSYQINNLFTYNFDLNEKHHFNILAGQSAEYFSNSNFNASVRDFPNNSIHVLSAGLNDKNVGGSAKDKAIKSYFGRLNYNFADKYLLELNYRYDGTSIMSAETRWGGFPSASAGWVASNENFFSNVDVISFLKLRGSWGQLGNQNIGGNYYPYTQTISTGQNYLWDGVPVAGAAVTALANPIIGWETTTIIDFGIDLNMFNNKIQIVADIFDKTSTDILYTLPIVKTLGNVSAPWQNVGEVQNRGWEIGIKGQDYFGEVSVFGGANISHVVNEVIDYSDQTTISGNSITMEGEAIRSYYGYIAEGYYQTQEELDIAVSPVAGGLPLRLGDVKYKDISGPDGVPDGKITPDYDREILGNPFPKIQYSFNAGASYKGFDIFAFFQGISGIKRITWYNTETTGQGSFTSLALDYWTEDNRDAPTPRWGNLQQNTKMSSFWVRNASYLRMKNLEIGYTLPAKITKKAKIDVARIYFSGVNLFTATDLVDYDPEKITNDERNSAYPGAKVYSFGLNITL